MKIRINILLAFIFCLALAAGLFFTYKTFNLLTVKADNNALVQALIRISICGNNTREAGEQCDNADLGGSSCQSLGYNSGSLTCDPACDFNTAACTTANNNGGGGGGGGGGGATPPYTPPVTSVIFSGRAYPLSKVSVLKDGQLSVSTVAGPDANFYVAYNGLSSGNYIFAVYGEDQMGRRSTLFTFPVYISAGTTTQVGGIFLAPTIAVDKTEVKLGENLTIFGQSVPEASVTISVHSPQEIFTQVKADVHGAYLYNLDTATLTLGEHETKAKSTIQNELSAFGKVLNFTVGQETVKTEEKPAVDKGDLNHDNKVNLIDFSITAYWYNRSDPPAGIDLNGDHKVNLIDFSILAFYWTG
jgi:hypothetical protein